MKKLISILAILALLATDFGAGHLLAATSATINIAVVIDHEASIDVVSPSNPIDFGNMKVDTPAVSSAAIEVTNDGSGVKERINVTASDPSGKWSFGTPGIEVCELSFIFTDTNAQPAADDPNWASSLSELIDYNVTKYLWVKFHTPTKTEVKDATLDVKIEAAIE